MRCLPGARLQRRQAGTASWCVSLVGCFPERRVLARSGRLTKRTCHLFPTRDAAAGALLSAYRATALLRRVCRTRTPMCRGTEPPHRPGEPQARPTTVLGVGGVAWGRVGE